MMIRSVPEPRAREGEVVVKVRMCGICGSDLLFYEKGFGSLHRIMGHEFSGDIVSTGEGVEGWKVGDRVVIEPTQMCGKCAYCVKHHYNLCSSLKFTGIEMDGGFAEFVTVRAYQLHRVSDNVTYEEAALVEPMAVALHAVKRAGINPGDSVTVFGGGPIGLFVMQWARAAGAGRIFVSEISEFRIAAARKSADVVLNPEQDDVVRMITDQTDGLGPDVVFECTGANAAEVQSMTLARKGGRVIILGVPHQETKVPFGLFFKEITVTGAFAYASLLGSGEFATCLDFIGTGRIDTSMVPTTGISLEHIVSKGFECAMSSEKGKILVLP
jgi:(R,R)-butanediol dehydrogenase/meso-butanediol dehydrogenase/diacetyl reductase